MFLTTLLNHFTTLILIIRHQNQLCLVYLDVFCYHRKELVKEYSMLSELIILYVSLWHSFKGIKVARLQKLQNLTFKLKRYQGCEGAKVEKVAKSDFQTLKMSRLQGCKGCNIRLFSFDPIKLGKRGGGGTVDNCVRNDILFSCGHTSKWWSGHSIEMTMTSSKLFLKFHPHLETAI